MQPRIGLIICASQRTGSGLLGSALWSTGVCGRPDEYFSAAARREYEGTWGCTRAEYMGRMVEFATTPNLVFGAKVHWPHVDAACRWLARGGVRHRSRVTNPFVRLAPNVLFCWVSRRDKIRQAVSLLRAEATGEYRRRDGAPPAQGTPSFDYPAIRRVVEQMEEWDACWSRYFSEIGVTPLRVCYEDDLENDYVTTVVRILESLGIDPPARAVTTDYQRQADDWSETIVRQYRDAERAVDG